MPPENPRGERLQKILSAAGIASRRAAEDLLRQRRVTVNGRIASLGDRASADLDDIRVDGKPIKLPADHLYLALNKPAGVVTTVADPQGRPTVMDLIEETRRVYPVGRLDKDTEGLLLLTDDGELANRLMHPSFEVEKTYVAEVTGAVDPQMPSRIAEGVDVGDPRPVKAGIRILDTKKGAQPITILEIKVHEGRKRVVRRMLEALGHPVVRLVRTEVGGIRLGRLAPGSYRNLTLDEVASLIREVGL